MLTKVTQPREAHPWKWCSACSLPLCFLPLIELIFSHIELLLCAVRFTHISLGPLSNPVWLVLRDSHFAERRPKHREVE